MTNMSKIFVERENRGDFDDIDLRSGTTPPALAYLTSSHFTLPSLEYHLYSTHQL